MATLAEHVAQERRKVAAGLQNLVLENEISGSMTVEQLIAWLRGEHSPGSDSVPAEPES